MLTLSVGAQGTKEDYQRAFAIGGKYSGKMTNRDVRVHVRHGEHKFWYSVYDGKTLVFKEVNADKNTVEVLPENPEKPRQRPQWRGQQRHPPTERSGATLKSFPNENIKTIKI